MNKWLKILCFVFAAFVIVCTAVAIVCTTVDFDFATNTQNEQSSDDSDNNIGNTDSNNDSDNGNSNNQGGDNNSDNTGNDCSNENSGNNESDGAGGDQSNDDNENNDDANNNDNNQDDNQNDNNGNGSNDGIQDDNDGEESQPIKQFEIKIYCGQNLICSKDLNGEMFSNLYNGEFTYYTLVIEANYEVNDIQYSSNIFVKAQTNNGYVTSIIFYINDGTSFFFSIDNKQTFFNCTRHPQYSYLFELAAGQSGVQYSSGVVTLTGVNEVMFQVLIYQDGNLISSSVSCPNLELIKLYGAYYVQINNDVTAMFNVENIDFSFTIIFNVK